MSTCPTVSVVMPMHNSAATITASVSSVLGQTFTDWELVIVNDSSTDASPAIVAEFAKTDARIQLLNNPGPRGAANARNVATSHARGRYIAFLDSDDLWLPTKLERQVEHFERTAAPLTFTWYVKIDGEAQVDAATFEPIRRVVKAPLHLTYKHMLRQDYLGFLTVMYDTERVGKRYFPDLKRRQDYAMLLQLMREGYDAYGVGTPLAVYRAARSGSLSSNKFKAAKYNWHIYRNVEGLPFPRALVAFCNYAVRSTLKYLI